MNQGSDKPALRVSELAYTYPGSGGSAIRLGELVVGAGERVVLTGRSGSGKSTLLHLFAGLMDPTHGTIEVAGTRLDTLRAGARDRFRGRHIGMVFQTFHLLDGFSAMENVLAALMFADTPKPEHRWRAKVLLDRLGIDRHGALAHELSVGQQQRVAVARALACGPGLVLADEPTASLDPELGDGAITLLTEVCRENGAALLCVTHDRSLVGRFDRHGELGADGGVAWR